MARRQVNIFINGREVVNQMKPIRAEKRKIVNELNNMTIGTEAYEKKIKELDSVNAIINRHRDKVRGIESSYSKISKGAVKFLGVAGIAFGAAELIGYGKELFRAGVEMDTLSRKAETVFAEALGFVTQKARENATAMGLTTSQYIDASTAIGDLLIPMGFQREEAAKISTNLVDLSGALSEWTGGQRSAKEVTDILGKAILGEREQLKSLGISIQEADVKARLAEKGLSKLTGEMLQQAKAAATLELITEKSADAQASFAKNSESAIRRQQELTAKISELGERMAVVLLPVFERLVSVASSVIDFLDGIAGAMESILDPAQAATDAFDEQQLKVDGLTSTLDPLLSRYDELTSKTDLTETEQQELKKVIEEIGGVVPTAITEFDKYGKALDINTEKVQEFIDAQKFLLTQKNKKAIDENNASLETMTERLDKVNAALSNRDADGDIFKRIQAGSRSTGVGFVPVIKNIKLTAEEIRNLQAEAGALEKQLLTTTNAIKILSGEKITDGGAPAPGAGAPLPDDGTAERERLAAESKRIERAKAAEKERKTAEKEAERAAERAAKQEEQEAEAVRKRLERLQEIVDQYTVNSTTKQLSADQQAITRIEQRYDEQIEKTRALEAEGFTEATAIRLNLERLREEELNALREEQLQARLEKEREAEFKLAEERKKAQEEIDAFVQEELLTARELALEELEEQYEKMRELAEKNGIDLTDITTAYRKKKSDINDKFDKEDLADRNDANKEQLAALAEAYEASAEIIGSALDVLTELGIENTIVGKALALAQIGFSSASAIAKATAAASGIPFPGNLGAIATAVGAVVSNISQAKKILNDTEVPQKRDGGWHEVTGAQDGQRYRAQYIGSPSTGMLSQNHPVLTASGVLANEVGREFYVSNASLRIPAVVDHVRQIENITKRRQFRDGGLNVGNQTGDVATDRSLAGSSGTATQNTGASSELMLSAVLRLIEILEPGIYAKLTDDTIVAANERLDEIDEASGGVIR